MGGGTWPPETTFPTSLCAALRALWTGGCPGWGSRQSVRRGRPALWRGGLGSAQGTWGRRSGGVGQRGKGRARSVEEWGSSCPLSPRPGLGFGSCVFQRVRRSLLGLSSQVSLALLSAQGRPGWPQRLVASRPVLPACRPPCAARPILPCLTRCPPDRTRCPQPISQETKSAAGMACPRRGLTRCLLPPDYRRRSRSGGGWRHAGNEGQRLCRPCIVSRVSPAGLRIQRTPDCVSFVGRGKRPSRASLVVQAVKPRTMKPCTAAAAPVRFWPATPLPT